MASYPAAHRPRPPETASGAFWMVATMLLGILVAIVGFFALLMWADAREPRDAAAQPATAAFDTAASGTAAHDHATDHNVALPLNSFAGVVPDNAAELAAAHKPYDATLPALPVGDLVKVHMTLKDMTLKDMTVEVAPGVKYNTWAFDGHGAPGPVVHFGRRRSRWR